MRNHPAVHPVRPGTKAIESSTWIPLQASYTFRIPTKNTLIFIYLLSSWLQLPPPISYRVNHLHSPGITAIWEKDTLRIGNKVYYIYVSNLGGKKSPIEI